VASGPTGALVAAAKIAWVAFGVAVCIATAFVVLRAAGLLS
jgi:hypothetical protein